MYKITVIATVHKEAGLCNSDELFRIVERIAPEVIFEEMSPNGFYAIYQGSRNDTLESKTIKRYIQKRQIAHVPVIRDSGKSQLAKIAHPPIDSILLKNLNRDKKIGVSKIKWTTIDEQTYLNLISELRKIEKDNFWKIERYWQPVHGLSI